ncbi:MAG: zinc metalloprotease HtpX [Bryobacteraceae bacterium]
MLNRIKTVVFMSVLTALFLWLGQVLGGNAGAAIALGFAAVMNLGVYWFSDQIVLRMYNAQRIGPANAPELYSMVRDLTLRARLPVPEIFLIPEAAPNAFATGRDPKHSSIAVTQGLLSMLNRDEIRSVIAHELGHIRNRDTLIMTVAATLAGGLSHIANMAMWAAFFGGGAHLEEEDSGHPAAALLALIIAPIAATLIQLAISRTREFLADEAGARMSENPLALARALQKLEFARNRVPMQHGNPATAHLFIVNPFVAGGLVKLFSTHPSTQERIARLESMVTRRSPLAA